MSAYALLSATRALVALALLTLAGCIGGGVEGPDFTPPPPPEAASVFVVTTDFQTGSYATFPVSDPGQVLTNLGRIHSDAVALQHDGLVYVINRLGGDSIQALDPQRGYATLWECSVGNGTNPHDLIFAAPDKAYVTLYEERELLIVDPSAGPSCDGFVRGTIDLGPLADDDGLPEMDTGAIIDGKLFVALQRLDRFAFFLPSDFSSIAVLDVATDRLIDADPSTDEVDGIRLEGKNPFTGGQGLMLDGDGNIVLNDVGSFGDLTDGGIERIDPRAMRSLGFLMTEAEFGGNLTDFVLVDETTGYAVVTDLRFYNYLVRFDPSARRVVETLIESDEYLVDLELETTRGELYLTDRTLKKPGIRIFDTSDGVELTPEPIDTGLPPFDVIFLPDPASSATAPAGSPARLQDTNAGDAP